MDSSDARDQAAGEAFDDTTRSVMPSEKVLRLHLLRHGAVEELERRAVRGQLDVPLSPEGERQTERLAAWMVAHEKRPDRLAGSDLGRCSQLGERLAELWELPYESTPALREQDMGEWQGLAWSEISERYGKLVNDYWDDYVHTAPAGGESMSRMQQRVVQWWIEAAASQQDGRLCVVTHVGVIRSLTCYLLDLPLDQALRLAPGMASHSKLLVSDAGSVIEAFGERPWRFGQTT